MSAGEDTGFGFGFVCNRCGETAYVHDCLGELWALVRTLRQENQALAKRVSALENPSLRVLR